MATNNRSWLSTSSLGSRDQDDDCHSLDSHSYSKEQQQNSNLSINSGNSGGMPNRTRSKGDRYNHYRRDGPAKVRPWMRDKAATGGSSRTGRFGGTSARGVGGGRSNADTSVGSNSCANSVSSNSSFPEAPARPLPSEVIPSAPFSARSLQDFDDLESISAPPEEVRQEEEMRTEKEEPLAKEDETDETATVNTEAATTEDTPVETNIEDDENNDTSTTEEPLQSTQEESLPKQEESRLLVEDEKTEKDDSVFVQPTNPVPVDAVVEPAFTRQTYSDKEQESRKLDQSATAKEEFYDVLPTIQPSSYNPMAARSYNPMAASKPTAKEPPPVSMADYATLERPTPLVREQSAFLDDPIEEASEEETSFDENESNLNNLSADTLQGIKALDATREEDEAIFDISRMELEKDLVVDDFHKMWPTCVDPADLPETIHPDDWEQRQTLAVGVTQTWIQTQLQQQLQGIDFKASAYSEFAAALSACPPLTSAFLSDVNLVNCNCFCPCSAQMVAWREEKLADTEQFLFEDVVKCSNQQFTPSGIVQHCQSTISDFGDLESRFLHGIIHCYLEALFDSSHVAFQGPTLAIDATTQSQFTGEPEEADADTSRGEIERLCNSNTELLERLKSVEDSRQQLEAKSLETSATSAQHEAQLNKLREDIRELEASNKELLEKLNLAEETREELAAKSAEATSTASEHEDQLNKLRMDMETLEMSKKELEENLRLAEEKESMYEARGLEIAAAEEKLSGELKSLQERTVALEFEKAELLQKMENAEALSKELESKNAATAASLEEKEKMLESFGEDVKRLGETNAQLVDKLQLAEEKHADAVASSGAQAEMMNGLCEEMKQLEEAKTNLQSKLEEAEETAKSNEAKHVAASTTNIDATSTIAKLKQEKIVLEEANATMQKNLTAVEDREKAQASRDQNVTLVHVGDMPVDLRRFHVQCQKYFSNLRVAQLKSHCVRDKSPVKLTVQYDRNDVNSIDIQKLLDKGAAVESQDVTYLFRALDTFNKGHFHTHKLLLPWKIVTTSGGFISRSEFFVQVWQQLGSLKIKVGEKKTEVPLFQESLGYLIPMPNAVLEGMLRVTPAELDRVFAAKIAPYYRAVGRLMVQCIAATADDSATYNLKIAGKVMPLILRHKLFRGVDPTDESYPLEQLLDHAFSLLGMADMTRDKAFEYFSIEAKDYSDTHSAVQKIRQEVQEMWIKERSLALSALEEGLTLNGLADMSFCCGLVPLEAVNEMLFTR